MKAIRDLGGGRGPHPLPFCPYRLKGKLEGTPQVEKLPAIQKPLTELLKNFKDLQFFTGESMNPDGMVVIGDYKEIDGEERPVLYFPKYGLEEEKL